MSDGRKTKSYKFEKYETPEIIEFNLLSSLGADCSEPGSGASTNCTPGNSASSGCTGNGDNAGSGCADGTGGSQLKAE